MEEKVFYYAGFWRRFAAHVIDQILIGIVIFILMIPFYFFIFFGVISLENFEDYEDFASVIWAQSYDDEAALAVGLVVIFLGIIIAVLSLIVEWLYYAIMEASKKQATLGKMAVGIKVIDMEGNRISFGRATGRFFGKILSGLILYIGFIMAAFTTQKQALHDMMASCLVILNKPPVQLQTEGVQSEPSQDNINP